MRVLTSTAEPDDCRPESGVTIVPLDKLLEESDVVTLHVDLNPKTRGMFGRAQFDQMKAAAWFINTARGELVDESALLSALESGKLAGAALDVLADEHRLAQGMQSHPLRNYAATHDNLIITPHIGGCTVESLAKTELRLVDKLLEMAGRDGEVDVR